MTFEEQREKIKFYQNKIENRAISSISQRSRDIHSQLKSMSPNPYSNNQKIKTELSSGGKSVLLAQIEQKRLEKLKNKIQDQNYRDILERK